MSLTVTESEGVTIFTCKRGPDAAPTCQFLLRGPKKGQTCQRRVEMKLGHKDYCRAHGQILIREQDAQKQDRPQPDRKQEVSDSNIRQWDTFSREERLDAQEG